MYSRYQTFSPQPPLPLKGNGVPEEGDILPGLGHSRLGPCPRGSVVPREFGRPRRPERRSRARIDE